MSPGKKWETLASPVSLSLARWSLISGAGPGCLQITNERPESGGRSQTVCACVLSSLSCVNCCQAGGFVSDESQWEPAPASTETSRPSPDTISGAVRVSQIFANFLAFCRIYTDQTGEYWWNPNKVKGVQVDLQDIGICANQIIHPTHSIFKLF